MLGGQGNAGFVQSFEMLRTSLHFGGAAVKRARDQTPEDSAAGGDEDKLGKRACRRHRQAEGIAAQQEQRRPTGDSQRDAQDFEHGGT